MLIVLMRIMLVMYSMLNNDINRVVMDSIFLYF